MALVGVDANIGINNMASGFAKICRTCATCTDCLMPIFSGEGLLNSLPDKIQRHLPIQVSEWDRLPQQLCRQCANTLLAWHELVKCCTQADAALRTRLQRIKELSAEEDAPTTSGVNITSELIPNDPVEQSIKCNDRVSHTSNVSDTRDPIRLSITESVNTNVEGLKTEPKSSPTRDYDNPTITDSSESEDDRPLLELASEKTKIQQLNRFYKALVNFKRHYDSHHGRSKSSEPESNSEEEISQARNADNYDDLSLSNKRKDCFGTETREELNRARTVQDGTVYYRCSQCGKNLRTTHTYIHHMRIHSGEKPCVCHLCGKQFRVSAGLHRHLRETHQKLKLHSCSICEKSFSNRQNLVQHTRIHTGEKPFVCTQCGKRFTQSGSLHIHMQTHTDHYPYRCATCHAKFRQRSALTHHTYNHTGEKPNVCGYCGKAYKVRHQLNVHMLIHTEQRPHACPACGLAFRQRRTMRNHCKRAHHSVSQEQGKRAI